MERFQAAKHPRSWQSLAKPCPHRWHFSTSFRTWKNTLEHENKTGVVGDVSRDVTLHFQAIELYRVPIQQRPGSSFAWLLLVLQLFGARCPSSLSSAFLIFVSVLSSILPIVGN